MEKPKLPQCTRCNFGMIPQFHENRLWCQGCGHVRTDPKALQIVAMHRQIEGQSAFPIGLNPREYPDILDSREAMFLEEAADKLEAGDKRAARLIAHDLINTNHRLVQAYYVLFLAASSTTEKARHLASIVTFEPENKTAKRTLDKLAAMVGKDIKPSFFTIHDHRAETQYDVLAEANLEVCPMCAGHTLYRGEDKVECLSCGYTPLDAPQANVPKPKTLASTLAASGGYHLLQEAMANRQFGTGKAWKIGERVLACQNCGTQLTLTGNMMTQQCAFCDSQHILEWDVVGSFQEPDVVLPVRLEPKDVIKLLNDELPSEIKVTRHRMMGVYLPYWGFRGLDDYAQHRDMLVPASQELSHQVLQDILPYDLRHLRPYDQRFLARWSAEVYTLDVIDASLQVKSSISGGIEYRLLLLPVWMVTLTLHNGGIYHGVVNAQTGEVVTTERIDRASQYKSRVLNLSDFADVIPKQQSQRSPIAPLPARDESVIRPLQEPSPRKGRRLPWRW